MADSYSWIARCVGGLGWTVEDWQRAYERNQDATDDLALEASKVGTLVVSFAETDNNGVPLTPTEFHKKLRELCLAEHYDWLTYFPASPKTLSDHIKRVAPLLRKKGVIWERGRTMTSRFVVVRKATAHDEPMTQHDAGMTQHDAPMTQKADSASCSNPKSANTLAKPMTHMTHMTQESQISPCFVPATFEQNEGVCQQDTPVDPTVRKVGNRASCASCDGEAAPSGPEAEEFLNELLAIPDITVSSRPHPDGDRILTEEEFLRELRGS